MRTFASSRFVKWGAFALIWLRRLLLELWAVLVMATIIGFMGPFGTYGEAAMLARVANWLALLMGAYVLVRPAIVLFGLLADATGLPRSTLAFWGVWICSAPLAALWRTIGRQAFRHLEGYAGLVPFSLVCCLAVLGVARWSAGADRRFAARADVVDRPSGTGPDPLADPLPAVSASPSATPSASGPDCDDAQAREAAPALAMRVSGRFRGPILALQSEDHYVRVHGPADSELVLIRLRDAIREMDGVKGEQVHRSWWVAAEAIDSARPSGRSIEIRLTNGQTVPVARDSIARLRRAGFLPGLPA